MKQSEIQKIIGCLSDYLYYGEKALTGEISGISLTQEQIDEFKQKCITAKNTALFLAKDVVPDTFDFEFDTPPKDFNDDEQKVDELI